MLLRIQPGYATAEVLAKAKKLKLAVTAGVGSDHIDLNAANEHKITVAEVSGSNVVSVAEHVVMSILLLVRNFVPAHEQIVTGGWNVAQVASNAYDLEKKVIGTLGAGRIGYRVLQRLKPFDPEELLYYDYQALPKEAEESVGCRRVEDLEEFLGQLDVLTINCPLHEKTKGEYILYSKLYEQYLLKMRKILGLINKETIKYMKKGAWIVNTARGAICDADAIAEALENGDILGVCICVIFITLMGALLIYCEKKQYAGDVWNKQPSPADHPWRKMRNPSGGGNGMVAHYSGTVNKNIGENCIFFKFT